MLHKVELIMNDSDYSFLQTMAQKSEMKLETYARLELMRSVHGQAALITSLLFMDRLKTIRSSSSQPGS